MCPGQLPGSTAKYLGSAYVLGRPGAVLGAWPCFPLSLYNRRAASESRGLLSGHQSSPQVPMKFQED